MEFKIRKGISFDFTPLSSDIHFFNADSLGIYPSDYPGLALEPMVSLGEKVLVGTPILTCKDLVIPSPVSGIVNDIKIGARRKITFISISNDFKYNCINFKYSSFLEGLLVSGLFAAFRTRPFDKIADPSILPTAIFINATDSYPYNTPASSIINSNLDYFKKGIEVISKFNVPLTLTHDQDTTINWNTARNICFYGKHPYGLIGTQLSHIYPVNHDKRIWYIGYQDVIAIGKFFNGDYDKFNRRIYTLHGVSHHVIENDLGFDAFKLMPYSGLISGSFLYGLPIDNEQSFIHRFHSSINLVPASNGPLFLEWLRPGLNKFTTSNLYLSSFYGKRFVLDNNLNGSKRAILPIGIYEQVCGLKTLIIPLLRSILTKDIDTAIKLGVLNLSPEDLAIFTLVCPGKIDYGKHLQELLDLIYNEKV